MELLQLRYFMNTAKNENISHTAQKFRVPASSVSASIKKLEGELGFTLFDRTANRLRLNANGRILLRAAEAAEKEFKKARIDMLNLSAAPIGEINLLILTNRRIVTDAISRFKLDYPGISFHIKHENYYEYSDYSDFDIVISDKQIDIGFFEKREFVREEIFVAVHNKSALVQSGKINLRNLTDEKFVCMPKGSSLRDYMDKFLKEIGVAPEIVIECDDPYYIREYVKMGLGVTFFPEVSWRSQIDDRVTLLRINDGIYRNSYIYINRSSSNAVKIFADTLAFSV